MNIVTFFVITIIYLQAIFWNRSWGGPVWRDTSQVDFSHIYQDRSRNNSPLVQSSSEDTLGDSEVELEEPIDETFGYFEGDIIGVNPYQIAGRNAIIQNGKKWSNGVIPYTFRGTDYSKKERQLILAAIDEYHQHTCLRFVPKSTEESFIVFTKTSRCASNIGHQGVSGQKVHIGSACLSKGTILHELMHAIGFWHEHSRTDRDDHVTVLWRNIKEGKEGNFLKYPWTKIQHLNEPYDIGSVMHYGTRAFSKDKSLRTIQAKDPSLNKYLGQRRGFSKIDIAKINKLYDCENDVMLKTQNLLLATASPTSTIAHAPTTNKKTEVDPDVVSKTPMWKTIFKIISKIFD